jgi:NAD(P)-dependent dehydrogenase (short-subunit alcohol dehydrogenase family)
LRLQGKVAIVTGAGSGIGQGIAERLGCEGAKVIVDYVGRAGGARQTERVIEQVGGAGEIVQAGITRVGDVRALVDEAWTEAWTRFGSAGKLKLNALLEKIPLGRLGKPEDVASLVTFLATGDAAYVTGSTFVVDGGLMRNYLEQ